MLQFTLIMQEKKIIGFVFLSLRKLVGVWKCMDAIGLISFPRPYSERERGGEIICPRTPSPQKLVHEILKFIIIIIDNDILQ